MALLADTYKYVSENIIDIRVLCLLHVRRLTAPISFIDVLSLPGVELSPEDKAKTMNWRTLALAGRAYRYEGAGLVPRKLDDNHSG